MPKTVELAVIAADMHDVGKICYRASGERRTHSLQGYEFLRPLVGTSDEALQLLRCVKYHHGRELGRVAKNLAKDDLAFLVYEADNISAGTDRRDIEEGDPVNQWDTYANLENIFNRFAAEGELSSFSLKPLDGKEFNNYPAKGILSAASQGQYKNIERRLKENFQKKNPVDMTPDELLRILEDTMIYVPSSTNRKEACDISLYDHVKITGAVAGALYQYMEKKGLSDYREYFLGKKRDSFRETPAFLLVSGDFSGIQDFIYRVPSKGAMRMLRGRSSYLDIMLENMADDLLQALGLSRANLIYSGGGHFYLLVDHTPETIAILRKGIDEINRQLAELFSASLYLAAAWEPVSANELMGRGSQKENMFRRVSQKLSTAKLKRYGEPLLADMFDETSRMNRLEPGMRECAFCHHSYPEEELHSYTLDESVQVCPVCEALYQFGKYIIDRKESQESLFAVCTGNVTKGLPLPSPEGKKKLLWIQPEDVESMEKEKVLLRLYDKNISRTASKMGARLWMADYAARDEKTGHVLDFNEMAVQSGEGEKGKGIKRLGILRADVDGLGAAFMAGFKRKDLSNPDYYATLSRYSALSRSLSIFFKRIIKEAALKHLPEGQAPFSLFHDKGSSPRQIHIVYAGGDDLFVAGAWDDLLEFAVDLRRAFAVYTNGKLSFSAGLGLFDSSYPVIRMAEAAGELEDTAKNRPGKDGIALFGPGTEYGKGKGLEEAPCYSWDAFLHKVKKEKLDFLLHHLKLSGINDTELASQEYLPAGKSLLYRLLSLLGGSRIDLARLAYTLARMEPDRRKASPEKRQLYAEIREKLYQWAMQKEDMKELETALRLVIYRMRDK